MRRRPIILASALAILGCFAGNLHPQGEVGGHYGDATRATTAQMIADPAAAERNREAVEGLDPGSAAGVSENYKHNERAEVQERKLRDQSLIQLAR
jgi:hypothetical protein